MSNRMCEYRGGKTPCANGARWKVAYLSPDDGKSMRQRVHTFRCYWHSEDPKFFPDGASQITILGAAPGDGQIHKRAEVPQ